MASPDEVEICIGRYEKIGTIARSTLVRFDRTASQVLTNTGHLTTRRLYRSTNANAAKNVLGWMRSQGNADRPRPLQPPCGSNGEPNFQQLVHMHAACYAFFVPRELRGDRIRKLILDYIDMAPLTFDEFVMIAGTLAFDGSLVRRAIIKTSEFKRTGDERGFPGVPQWQMIEAYCHGRGIELSA